MKRKKVLLAFLGLALASCETAPEYVSPKEELASIEGRFYSSFSETTSILLSADFTIVFTYVSAEGKTVDRRSSFSMRQLRKDENHGFGLLVPPSEGERVYEITVTDASIGEDALDPRISGMAKNLYLSHWYSGTQTGGFREVELSNAEYCGPTYDSEGNEVGYQPPLLWWKKKMEAK